MAGGYQLNLRVIVLVIAISAPMAMGLETLARTFILAPAIGPEFDEIREFFSPPLTRFAWGLTGACVLAGGVGIALLRRAFAKLESESGRDETTPEGEVRDKLLLLTSIPQIPAILATLCFMLGSSIVPVLVCMAISTVFVLIMGFVGERHLHEAGISQIAGA